MRIHRRLLFAALLLGATAPIYSQAQERATREGAKRTVADVLETLQNWSAVPESTNELAAIGRSAIPELFEALTEGSNQPKTTSERNAARRTAACLALERLSGSEVRAFLVQLVAENSDTAVRASVVRFLGRVGTRHDLGLLADLAAGPNDPELVEREVRCAFEEALARIVARDHGALARLAVVYAGAHPSLLAPIAKVIGTSRSHRGLEELGGLLGRRRPADAMILAEIGQLADTVRGVPASRVSDRVSTYLSSDDPRVAALAARAQGKLRHHGSVPDLIELLGHEDASVRSAAQSALGELTSMPFGGDPEPWRSWFDDEKEWWTRRAHDCARSIRATHRSGSADAIREVAKHGLYPDEQVALLSPGLEAREPDLVVMTCRALGTVGSEAAIPLLLRALEHGDGSVRVAAAEGLRRVTGLQLPAEVEAWRTKLGTAR